MANTASLTLDGTGDYANRTGDDNTLDLTTTWTIECWVYTTAWNVDSIRLISKGAQNWDNAAYYMRVFFSTLQCGYENGFNDYQVTYDVSGLATSTWHHFAATYESNVVRIYVNGSLVATSGTLGAAPVATSYRFVVGGEDSNGSILASAACKIDEVRVWSTRRSDAEIADYYDIQASGSETGLVACWHFNSAVTDATSGGLTLTLTGNATYDTGVFPTLTDASSGMTGTIASTMQKATSALAGTHKQTGAIAATMQKATSALAGVMQPKGAVASTMQKATASLVGTQKQIGSIASSMRAATASLAGTQSSVAAAITGTAVSITEQDVVTGGKTIIITLTGTTWIAA
jgi:hypothetical protein